MDIALPLEQMTVEEKLRAMEALWADLSRSADSFGSPSWHDEVLRERDRLIAEGGEVPIEWAEAKRQLRERFP